ncbi:hypothetical protein MKX03_023244 [Papaver bracteatum]|nr:hypothetical protein MKX03_023244 [Papaver bracteatum]
MSSIAGDDHDPRLHETIMLSTKLMVESQEAMLRRIEACNEASNARVETTTTIIATLLGKIAESQSQNQLQMMERLKILANSNTSIKNAGISIEAAVDSPVVIPNGQNRPGIRIVGGDMEEQVVENESSESDDVEEQKMTFFFFFFFFFEAYQEDDEEYHVRYEHFKKAVSSFAWKKAKDYLNDPQIVIKITKDSRQEIHGILGQAVHHHRYKFVEKFLKLLPPKKLEYVNPDDGDSILHIAVKHGGIKIVKALVKKNPNLTQIWSTNELPGVPLLHATKNRTEGWKEVVEYLCSETREDDPSSFSGNQGAVLLIGLISADMYGTAYSVCQRFPKLVKGLINGYEDRRMPTLLQVIVERPFAFLSGSKLSRWERSIYALIEVDLDPCNGGIHGEKQKFDLESTTKEDEENPLDPYNGCDHYVSMPFVKEVYDQKLMHEQVVALTKYFLAELREELFHRDIAFHRMGEICVKEIFLKFNLLENAIKFGTTEFVLECLRVFPFLYVGHTLIKLVVSERNEMIYNFRRICANETVIKLDKNKNSILHYCAELPHNRQLNVVSGAAFQMQREIQWFKWVESTMPHRDRLIRNNNGDTAQFLFTENHRELMKEGEKWMKDTSASCMLVSALIATVAFAAAITVPGGNIQDNHSRENGLPVFLKRNSFFIFATADALALFSSITSVLIFLAVFTSRYSEEDFLKALPQRLILGLATLFISMASILVSFGAAFTIVLGQRFRLAPLAVSLFSCAPILLFGFLEFPLFVEMVSSTYWPTFSRKKDIRIYQKYFSEKHWKEFRIKEHKE